MPKRTIVIHDMAEVVVKFDAKKRKRVVVINSPNKTDLDKEGKICSNIRTNN